VGGRNELKHGLQDGVAPLITANIIWTDPEEVETVVFCE